MQKPLLWVVVALFLGTTLLARQKNEEPQDAAAEQAPSPEESLAKVRYWKGNLHTHSLWSDGDDFPEMIADWYKRNGYHFLAMSDHNVQAQGQKWVDAEKYRARIQEALAKYDARFGTRWVERRQREGRTEVRLKPLSEYRTLLEEPGRFLMIPSEEITHRYSQFPVHINVTNILDVIQPIDGTDVSETIRVNMRSVYEQRRRTGQPMVPHLNHPNFHWGVTAEQMAGVEEMQFFEIFNGHPSVNNYGDDIHASCERIWDVVLALRLGKFRLPIVYGVATDDAHRYHTFGVEEANPGRGWIYVKAPYLSPEAIVHGMEAGEFYCSSGVKLLNVGRVGRNLQIAIDAEPGAKYRTEFIATFKDVDLESEPQTDAKGVPVTSKYSSDIGKVVHVDESTQPSYEFTGKELYVRARITSDIPQPNPYREGDTQVAWTQPYTP